MKDSKLLSLISPLDAWQIRHLRDFVHSPFFNKHDRLTQLFDYIISLAPAYPSANLDRNLVYRLVFEGESWDEQKFKDLLSLGVKLMRQFFLQMRIKEQPNLVALVGMEDLLLRGSTQEFLKARSIWEPKLEQEVEKLQEGYLKKLLVQEMWISRQSETGTRKADDSIQSASDLLDAYFLLSKLRYAVEMANRANVVSQEFRSGLLVQALTYLETHPEIEAEHVGIRTYLLILRCLTRPDSHEDFAALRSLIEDKLGVFPITEQREIQAYALNFCIRQVNKGQREYLQVLVGLYQTALENGTLLSNGTLSQWDYKNIVSAGLKAGNFEWSREFIEAYKNKVEPEARENAYTYNSACLHFEQGDYKTALRMLQHVEFSDVFYHLGAKVMLLKSFYELGDYEALNSLCESFKIYLKRNKTLSKAHYTVNFNLVGFTKRLNEIRRKSELVQASVTQAELAELRRNVEENRQVAQLPWLLSKIELLENQTI